MTLESRIQPETRCRHMNEVRPTGACDVCHPEMFPPRAEVERQIRALELRRAMRDLRVLVDDLEEVANRCSPDMNAKGVQSLHKVKAGRPPLHVGCSVEGCEGKHYALDVCAKHYYRDYRKSLNDAKIRRNINSISAPATRQTSGGLAPAS